MLATTLRSHYKIVKLLGIGRSGPTYLAEDLDLPNSSLCVIKNIHSDDSDAATLLLLGRKLFDLQTSIAYQVGQHPQIPTVIAKFEENGQRYLVREYIEGELLSRELATGLIWNQTQVFDFLMDLINILYFVHSFKYIHQDINPHNIIRGNDDDRFYLIGFSLVEKLESEWQNLSEYVVRKQVDRLTQTSVYIASEQEQNCSQFNSDIYAVGAIAIQALTGKFPPYRDPDSYEFIWRDDVKIDSRLIEIIDKMVRPDYRNRYQSAQEVLHDLQSFAASQIPSSRATGVKPLPPSRFNGVKPYLIFGTIYLIYATFCTLIFGFGAFKLFFTAVKKPQLTLAPADASNQASWQTYRDKTTGIKIEYAPTWHREDNRNVITGEHAIFISSKQSSNDRYRENISIRVEKLTDARTTLADYTKSAHAEIERFNRGAKIIESSSTSLAKRSANIVIYTGNENSLPTKNLEVWTIDRGKAYILTYKAEAQQYDKFLPTAMKTIESFELD